jgi:hypothetical protein
VLVLWSSHRLEEYVDFPLSLIPATVARSGYKPVTGTVAQNLSPIGDISDDFEVCRGPGQYESGRKLIG